MSEKTNNTIYYSDGTQVEIDSVQKPILWDKYGNRI